MTDDKTTGKKGPTPARKSQEAANRRPLVGDKSKDGKKLTREQVAAERRKAREGMMRGEERYLPVRDRGPQKRLARDIVDSRFTAGEMILPAMFAFLLVTGFAGQNYLFLQFIALVLMWVLFIIVAVDAFLIGRKVSRTISQRYAAGTTERGIAWYAAMRSIQLRPMRIPKPQVKRGTKI